MTSMDSLGRGRSNMGWMANWCEGSVAQLKDKRITAGVSTVLPGGEVAIVKCGVESFELGRGDGDISDGNRC